MALFPLGILSAAGAGGGAASDYELISTTILGSSQSSVVFDVSTYASTYKHLQIRYVAKSTRSSTLDGFAIRFNADTGTNYSAHFLRGNGSSASSGVEANVSTPQLGIIPAASSTNNVFGAGVADLLDPFSTTKYKTFKSLYGTLNNDYVGLNSGLWRNTNSITSITLFQTEGANNLLTGSRFSLYGLKG